MNGYQQSFGPGGGSDPASALVHWLVYGNAPNAGLLGAGKDVASMFNPTHPSGVLNILSMFAGKSPEGILNHSMPGQFEGYSLPKATASGQVAFKEGQPYAVKDLVQRVKDLQARQQGGFGIDKLPHMQADMAGRQTGYAQTLHDLLFGGEVHAKGAIPRRP